MAGKRHGRTSGSYRSQRARPAERFVARLSNNSHQACPERGALHFSGRVVTLARYEQRVMQGEEELFASEVALSQLDFGFSWPEPIVCETGQAAASGRLFFVAATVGGRPF